MKTPILKKISCLIIAFLLALSPLLTSFASTDEEETVTITDIPGAVILECEDESASLTASNASVSYVTEKYKTGAKSVKYNETTAGGSWSYDGAAIDVSDYAFSNLALSFWLYVDDISKFDNLKVDLRARDGSGTIDNRLTWFVENNSVIKNSKQWVNIILQFPDSGSDGSAVLLDKICGIKFSYGSRFIIGTGLVPCDLVGSPAYYDDIKIIEVVKTVNFRYLFEIENENAGDIGAAPNYPATMVSDTAAVGTKSLKLAGGITAQNNPAGIWKDFSSPLNLAICDIEDMAISFYMKMTDISVTSELRFNIHDENGKALRIYPKVSDFLKGNNEWGQIYVKLGEAFETHADWLDAGFDISAVKNFSIDFGHKWVDGVLKTVDTTGIDIWFDSLRIEKVSPLKFANYYQDGMVFQQKKPLRIKGYAESEKNVTVSLINSSDTSIDSQTVKTAKDGSFTTELAQQNASFDTYKIKLESNGLEAFIENVLIGELWLACGQSNLELKVVQDLKRNDILSSVTENATRANNLRIFSCEPLAINKSYTPVDKVENGKWKLGSSKDDVDSVSAVGYAFALELYNKLNKDGANIPVGILSVPKGAAPIAAYMSRELWDATTDYKNEKWPPKYDLANWNTAPDFYLSTMESAMYNHYIHPLSTLNIGGMLWYQGESDAAFNKSYYSALKALINSYRRIFSHGGQTENIPFVAIQPHPHNYVYNPDGGLPYDMLPKQLENYVKISNELPMVEAVPIYDLPLDFVKDYGAIHPGIKQPVGIRSADTAYSLAYAKNEQYLAPKLGKAEVIGSKIKLTFKNVGDGLKISDASDALHGFAICGSNRIYIDANAKITGSDTVEVWNDTVETPEAAHYAFSPLNMKSNLANSQGIVCLPFRTDNIESTLYRPKDWQYCDDEKLWISWSALGSAYDTTAELSPAWKLSEKNDGSLNTGMSFSEHAMLIDYTNSSGSAKSFAVGPYLAYSSGNLTGYPGLYNDFENYDLLYFDVKNMDSREKLLKAVEITASSGSTYSLKLLSSPKLKTSDDYQTFCVSLKKDSADLDLKSIIKNIKDLSFIFEDNATGSVRLDNIRFGFGEDNGSGNHEEDDITIPDEPEDDDKIGSLVTGEAAAGIILSLVIVSFATTCIMRKRRKSA